MDSKEYRQRGKEMVDYIADYLDNVASRRVFPDVRPGFLHAMLPESAPLDGEPWDQIMADVERVIMPGVTHWQSPHMHAYFPALNSYPSLLGDMLADAINCLGFTWASSPACTELETVVMNWLGKMIGLPEEFLQLGGESTGGGVIQTTASESTLVCLLAGRTRAIKRIQESNPELEDAEVNARLVAYCSDQAHSSVEKAGLIGLVRMRYIEADENMSMRGDKVKEALQKDRAKGLIPFWLCASLGTTGACSFDNLQEIGPICEAEGLWLHIDAAYAGSAFVCPEFRHWIKGIELADSIAFNPSKWLMVHFDCTALWVKNSKSLHSTFNVNPIYLQHENTGRAIDYMHWQIPLSRRFRALKLWFVLRNYGVKGLQKHIREGVRLAQKFEALVLADPRFEIPAARHLGMVVFRLRGANELTERLLKSLNARGNIHCVPACLHTRYVIRFTVTSARTTNEHIIQDWAEIRSVAKNVLIDEYGAEDGNIQPSKKNRVTLKETRELNSAFGTSLLLANSPMSPKIVDGSFVAIRDYGSLLNNFADTFSSLQIEPKDSPAMRRRIRGIMTTGKQFSLDSCMDMVQGMLASAGEGQDLPLMSEEKEEQPTPHTSGGSSPGDKVSANSSQEPSVQEDLNYQQLSITDSNQLSVPSQSGRHYRSRSVDTTLPGYTKNQSFEKSDMIVLPESLQTFESSDASLSKDIDTIVFINDENNELPKLSDRGQSNAEKMNGNKEKCDKDILVRGSAAKSVVLNPNVNIKHAGNDETLQNVENMSQECEDDERKFNKLMQEEEMDMFVPISVREKSTGGYIKRFFQQFSEQSFDSEGKSDATPGMSNEKASPIRKKVDDICKKCLHYKGQVNNNKE